MPAKKATKKRRLPGPRLVQYDFYEIMERGYLPTIQDAIMGTGSFEAWDLYLSGFRTAEHWIHSFLVQEKIMGGDRVG